MDRLSHKYFLTAGESDAEGRMPLTLVAERIIEVATEHANSLGIGYATLITRNLGWVLSRLSIEMTRFPAINEEYCVTTWIETYNRRFSERNFEFTDASGAVIGYARTVWVPMNFATRTLGDISAFGADLPLLRSRLQPPCEYGPLYRPDSQPLAAGAVRHTYHLAFRHHFPSGVPFRRNSHSSGRRIQCVHHRPSRRQEGCCGTYNLFSPVEFSR